MSLSDANERRRALTELDTTLLVEAAAGTGKTAIIAGRAVALLAAGRDPAQIAAITFTELAAGELGQRIRGYVAALLADEVPGSLALAFPDGLSQTQRTALAAAAARLDDLTAATIHGFCWSLVQAYAVEADIDPGASVLDGAQADTLFDDVLVRWLTRCLAEAADDDDDDPIAVLAKDAPQKLRRTVRELAQLRRRHRTARPPPPDLAGRADIEFTEAVREFGRWAGAAPAEPRTAAILGQLAALADGFRDTLAGAPSFARLLELSRPTHQPLVMRSKTHIAWKVYPCSPQWRRLAGEVEGGRLAAEAEAHYDRCRRTFVDLMGQLAARLVGALDQALEEPLALYGAEKRAAAVIDFDDLLILARRLLRTNEDVRAAIGRRYRFVLVDEFQDTDPVQAEIIFNIAAGVRPETWLEAQIVPGSLFLVGDPKQAIYGFRGADPATYADVRQVLTRRDPDSVIQLTNNFRSAAPILEHVNACFAERLGRPGQSGYVALSPTRPASNQALCGAVALNVPVTPGAGVDGHREDEALAVARLCRRLIGSMEVRRADGSSTALRPGDIALLAPTGTGLWPYERALEDEGLSVASQAGKTLMRRQETQDVLALLRTLADVRDTLAFGALMRGPLVGLTEARLLAITAALPTEAPVFSLRTDPATVADPVGREVLETLQQLRRRAVSTTPAALLAEALERLKVRVAIALRTGRRRARALANLGALQQLAAPFAVRGLRAFVAYLQSAWETPDDLAEGRSDEDEDAVSLVTIHSSKGLEWPVVIPINTSTGLRESDRFAHRRTDNTLHWTIGGLEPPELPLARAQQSASLAFERERLLYVACTRARDLLVLPKLPPLERETWSGVIDLRHAALPVLDVDALPVLERRATGEAPNEQDAGRFAAEARRVAEASVPIAWRRPSDADDDRLTQTEIVEADEGQAVEAAEVAGAGRLRGILIHKLLEEVLTGELPDDEGEVGARAEILLVQLASMEEPAAVVLPDPGECAATARRTLALPEIASVRPRLRAEVPAYGTASGGALIAARADAVAMDGDRIDTVIDWKSDVAPSAEDRARHAGQLGDYLALFGAARGALVYASLGEVVWITPTAEWD